MRGSPDGQPEEQPIAPTEAPDRPGRAGRPLAGRPSGLATRQDAYCLLVSYKALAHVQLTYVKLLRFRHSACRLQRIDAALTHLLLAQQPSRLAPLLGIAVSHPSSSTSECYLETQLVQTTPSPRRHGSPHAPPLDDDDGRCSASASTSTGTGDGGGEALLPVARRGAVAQRARALFI